MLYDCDEKDKPSISAMTYQRLRWY